MNELSLHIEYLLRSHDCVIVPGVGAFKADTESARYDRELARFMPPGRRISFNAAIQAPGDLLAHSYARRGAVSFEQGKVMLRDSAREVSLRLAQGLAVELPGVGTLTPNGEGRASFTPCASAAMASDLYQPVALPVASPREREQVIKTDPRYYYFKVNRTLLNSAAAILVAFVSVFSLVKTMADGSQGLSMDNMASVVPLTTSTARSAETQVKHSASQPGIRVEKGSSATLKSDAAADASAATANASKAMATADASAATAEVRKSGAVVPAAEQTAQSAGMHHLVVATFHTEREAEKFVAMHEGNGICPLKIVKSRRLCRVAAASSSNKEQLARQQRDKAFRAAYPDSWVYTEK